MPNAGALSVYGREVECPQGIVLLGANSIDPQYYGLCTKSRLVKQLYSLNRDLANMQ